MAYLSFVISSRRRWLFGALLAVATGVLTAGARPLQIVALNTVLTEVAQEVGGAETQVKGIVPPGVDPHGFEPTVTDLRAIIGADLVLASGLQLESYLDRLATRVDTKARILSVGDALPNVLSLASEHGHPAGAEKDPHWWHSIENVRQATEIVRGALTNLRPEAADTFARNARAYEERLAALKRWTDHELSRLPAERRQLVTSHEAFGYFARDYGFEVHAISGLSTDGEPNAKHLAGLIDLIRQRHIQAVFAESSVNPRVIANLLAETGVRLGGTLYADGLGPAGSDAATYEAMVRHNVTAIVNGLAPAQ